MRWRATYVTDLALDDLRKAPSAERHFLWAHYFDAHGPRAQRALPSDTPRFPPMAGESESSESKLYLSELSYIDHEVGRLINGIDESPFANRTMIIVTGDHGEGFGSHNVHEHGSSPFEQIIHVPGILVAPGISPGIYAHVVSHRDIVATVLGAFGLVSTYPHSEDFGRSWLRLRAAPQSPLHDFVITYSASAHVDAWSDAPLAVRTDDHAKLAVAYRDGIERYYHLDSVAGELRDLTYDLPDEVARDRRELELYRDIDSPPP
jgi:arylsulfatase A-like enzyme